MAFNPSQAGDGVAPVLNALLVYKTTVSNTRGISVIKGGSKENPWVKKPRTCYSQLRCRTPQKGEAAGGAEFGL